jgi:hypothetical protein
VGALFGALRPCKRRLLPGGRFPVQHGCHLLKASQIMFPRIVIKKTGPATGTLKASKVDAVLAAALSLKRTGFHCIRKSAWTRADEGAQNPVIRCRSTGKWLCELKSSGCLCVASDV